MMQITSPSGQRLTHQPIEVSVHQPIVLNDPEQIWSVKSGELSLFRVLLAGGIPQGVRHYLFTVKAGELMWGLPPTSEKKQVLLAVATAGTVVQPLTTADLIQQAVTQADATLARVNTWIHHLGSILPPLGGEAIQIQTQDHPQTFQLQPSQSLQPAQGTVIWIQIRTGGRLQWSGIQGCQVVGASGLVPVGPQMWVTAAEPSCVQIMGSRQVNSIGALLHGLSQLHTFFGNAIDAIQSQEIQQIKTRLQQRQQLQSQMMANTLDQLAGVLQPTDQSTPQPQSPLLAAAQVVGRAIGADIKAPVQSENMNVVRDPLQEIARASHLRLRRVHLTGKWWHHDAGPLMGYAHADHQPVALIPKAGRGYILFDPVHSTSRPVSAALAAHLSPVAYSFYRSLPPDQTSPLQILRFGLWGRGSDLKWIGLCVLAVTLLGMLTPLVTGILIDWAIPDANRALLLQLGLGLFAAGLGALACQLTQNFATLRVEAFAASATSAAIWDRLLNLPISFFRQYATGDLETRASGIDEIRRQLTGTTLQSLVGGLFALLNLGLLLSYSGHLAIVALSSATLSFLATCVLGSLMLRNIEQLQAVQGEITGRMVEMLMGIAKLRVAGAETGAFAYWGKQYTQQQQLVIRQQQLEDLLTLFNQVLPAVSATALFLVAAGPQNNHIDTVTTPSLGAFLAFYAAFGAFVSGVTSLSNSVLTFSKITALWRRARPILDTNIEFNQTKTDPGQLRGQIQVDQVSFRYREDGPPILDQVSLKADAGEFIALVGPSGSGKSTLLHLLLGFENPCSGRIYYDDQDLSGLDPQAIRRQLGVVLQNGQLMSGSIFESIAAGALISFDDAWEAAQSAGLAEDIRAMPMGMHTVISEGGSNLSGGQRQRLLIARALALKPRVLLFDEATSALDNQTQAIVSQSLEKLCITRIVIAHRLSTIRRADRIYVLQSGHIIEVGCFEELITRQGAFATLMAKQHT